VQAPSIHVVVPLTKAGLVHRQWVSVWPQEPRSAEAMQGLAQSEGRIVRYE
jgi:predicted component of type VI protein secretion system